MSAALSGVAGQWWRRWTTAKWLGGQRRPRELKLCESLSLGERRFVAVIEFRNQHFLVGGTNSSIALLAQIPPEHAEER